MAVLQLGRGLRAFLLTAACAASAVCSAAPPNDDCSGAIEVTSGSTVFSLDDATASAAAAPTCPTVARDLWYRFTPATTGPVNMYVCGNFQPIGLTVYAGSCGSLSFITCFDIPTSTGGSCPPGSSSPYVVVTGGVEHFIRLSSAGLGALGGGRLVIAGASVEPAPFTYQGQLKESGAAAAGPVDLRFTMFVAATGAAQLGLPQTVQGVHIADDGTFTVDLDFRLSSLLPVDPAFPDTFLEIAVRRTAEPFVTLSPRQRIAKAPYSTLATHATLAAHASTADSAASAVSASNGGSGGVRLYEQVVTSVNAAPLNPLDWTDVPSSSRLIPVAASDATFAWSLSGSTDLPASVFEVRPVFGAVTGTPVRWTFNPAGTHLSASGSCITTTPEGSIAVKLQVRRINGTARLLLDSNDSVSWTLTTFVHP